MYISSQGSYMSRSPTVLPQGLSGLLKSLLLLEQPNRSEYFSEPVSATKERSAKPHSTALNSKEHLKSVSKGKCE
jgi:hypothetical protein